MPGMCFHTGLAGSYGGAKVKLKNDARLRKRLFVEDAMSHPAKGHIGMWQAIIEKYTEPGDWVCDPMAGIGTTLVAALMGRNVICNEMEQHFLEPMVASWAKMRRQPMLGFDVGQVVIVRGDARHLGLGSADSIITSPPYEGSIQGEPGIDWTKVDGGKRDRTKEARIDSVKAGLSGYTRPVDAVISSPLTTRLPGSVYQLASHSTAAENIGNQKGDAYWESMKLVYQECHRILKPGGIMALVLGGFTRDGLYIDLPTDTMKLCTQLGFEEYDHWLREKWSLSFWRILQKKKGTFDDRLNYEHVWVFKKPLLGHG